MKLVVVGAGGHAKVVVDAATLAGMDVVGVVGRDGDPSQVQGVPVVTGALPPGADSFIIAVGDNRVRAKMFAEYTGLGLTPATVVHPSAIVARSAAVGAGSFLAAGVIVNADTRVGENVILNTACTVDHDCVVADHAHLGPNVSLCGGIVVGEGALVGVGSCVIGGSAIGAWSVVGAGAAVTGDLPADSVCVGVPARPIRTAGERT